MKKKLNNISESGPQENNYVFSKFFCPKSHQLLHKEGDQLISADGVYKYKISAKGIPLFAESFLTSDAQRQRIHYDKVASKYVENLDYPHTIEYLDYLDKKFIKQIDNVDLSDVAEICCGHGELLSLLKRTDIRGVGVDISTNMLECAQEKHGNSKNFIFVQGDATQLPFQDEQFSSVFMFGGIHHVPDRVSLFSEISRILKPGGRFYFREPVSDFFLWRWLRSIIYTVSPALDAETERPLLWAETVPLLEKSGFKLRTWKTYGFFGFCVFMNSDVLVFNRLFRFIPGIRTITRFAAYIDDLTVKFPGLSKAGLQVIGVAEKSELK